MTYEAQNLRKVYFYIHELPFVRQFDLQAVLNTRQHRDFFLFLNDY